MYVSKSILQIIKPLDLTKKTYSISVYELILETKNVFYDDFSKFLPSISFEILFLICIKIMAKYQHLIHRN